MITFNKIYIWLSKITYLSLHSLPSLIILENIKIISKNLYEKLRFPIKKFQFSYPIEVILNALQLVIFGMVDVFLGLWKYFKK